MMKRKKVTPTIKKYRKQRADPAGKVVRRHLENMIQSSGLSEQEIIERLKKYGKTYSSNEALKIMIFRSTLNLRSFIRLMLALDIHSYSINISLEESEEIKLYKELMSED